ncbi:MAG: Crp/Fnr family transcriptional regulator [Erysipelotrichaceae bacterium]|nr:Crp/Fnr family transcriptional regulator [Erysipelotrichaceae bacterium]
MNIINLLTEQEIKEYIRFKYYDSNQVVFNEGAKCYGIGIVLEGEILIKTYTYNIKEEIITVIKENNLFGQFLIFSSQDSYLGIGITSRKTKVAYIPKSNLIKLLSSNKAFLEAYMEIICKEAINIKQQAKLLAHKNIRDRIMYYLISNQKDKIVYIDSVTTLSNILSIPRPSVSRELTNMEDDGLIKRAGKIIYIK